MVIGMVANQYDGNEAMYLSDLTDAERNDMDDAELRKIAFEYERDSDNGFMRSMARRGTLEEYLDNKVRHARSYAFDLIEKNEDPDQAWNRAIRICLLGRDED